MNDLFNSLFLFVTDDTKNVLVIMVIVLIYLLVLDLLMLYHINSRHSTKHKTKK